MQKQFISLFLCHVVTATKLLRLVLVRWWKPVKACSPFQTGRKPNKTFGGWQCHCYYSNRLLPENTGSSALQSLSPNYYWIAFDQSYQNSPTILLGNFKSPTQTTESATNINSSIHLLNSPWTSDMHLSHSQKDCKETVHLKMAHSEAQLNLKSVWCNKKSYLDPKILGLVKQSIVFCRQDSGLLQGGKSCASNTPTHLWQWFFAGHCLRESQPSSPVAPSPLLPA